jgi:hypothetical protein
MIREPRSDDDRIRLIKSVSAAVLIASVGFAVIFLFFGSLPYFTLHWLNTLPPARATRILSVMGILARVFAVLTGLISSLMLVPLARQQRSKSKRPIPPL